jgi:CubicO group peptidase (beta-lactamase class C family)
MLDNTYQVHKYLRAAIERRVFPGCALGWTVDGKTSIITAGRHNYNTNASPVMEDSLFDCASVTKAIPVSTLALHMADRGQLGLGSRLIDFVPEYRGSFRDDITVKHLLTHTLDFDFRLSEYKDLPPRELLESILTVKMKSPPGEKFCYANATSILLGMLLEKIGGKPLQILAKETFFDPLRMNSTTFFPDTDNVVGKCVPTEVDQWRGRAIRGEVHDESAWVLREIMTAGSAGMFSTVVDLLKFVQMLIDESGGGQRSEFFKSETVQAMCTNQIPHISGCCTGLGWELNQEYMGANRTASTIGKTGFTGCTVIIDLAQKAGFALLSNCTWPARKPNRDLINQVRADVADLVMPPLRSIY